MSDSRLTVAPGPFLHCGNSVQKIYLDFCIALVPALAAGYLLFGLRTLLIAAVCAATAVVADMICQKITDRPLTPGDFNALYMGLLFALLMPPTVPLWIPVVGVAFAVVIGKHFFGGLGTNPFSPVLIGLMVVRLSWSDDVSRWIMPHSTGSAAVNAMEAPVEILKKFGAAFVQDVSARELLLGLVPGPIGVCALAVLVGGIFLLVRKRICITVPAGFLVGVYAFAAWKYGADPAAFAPPMFHVLAGSVMLGAFFLATDFSSSPVTLPGKIIFGLGCGAMTMLIRTFGAWPDGVILAVLLMNLTTPLLDRIKPRVIGLTREVRANG